MAAKKVPSVTPAPESSVIRFNVAGETYEVDGDHLSWGEVAGVEQYFDADFSDLRSAASTLALAMIAVRRKKPGMSHAEIAALELDEISSEETERPTPTPASGGGQS